MSINKPSLSKANTLLFLQVLSDMGDHISTALLALCMLDITQSTGKVGLVYCISICGFLLFTLIGGYIGDRFQKRSILVLCDIGRALVVVLMLIAVQEKMIEAIYVSAFFLSVLGALHRPTRISLWAHSTPSFVLERYNSLLECSVQASAFFGPLIASYFILKQNISLGFSLDALSFLVCAAVFFRICIPGAISSQLHQRKRNIFSGFRALIQHHEMMRYVAYDSIQMISFGAFNATFLVLAQRDFAWTKIEYSYHLSIVALCTTIGALCGATRRISSIDSHIKLIACALISAVALWIMLVQKTFFLGSVLIGIAHGTAVITMAVTRTKVQLLAQQLCGQDIASIIAARSIVIKAATLLGTGTCLLLSNFLSLQFTLIILVIPILCSCLPFLRYPFASKKVPAVPSG